MLRSMFSGVSGLRSHQTKMDVIGNNIANINTVGFKSSRVTFQEIYNQTLKAASAPTSATGRGGINAQSVGLGVSVASIDVFHTQGGAQTTDKATDLSLDGDGFFILSDGESTYYTRAGNFDEDPFGYLVSAGGLKVQGWTGRNDEGDIITTGTTREINLANLSMPPNATTMIRFEGNLESKAEKMTGLTEDEKDKLEPIEYTVNIVDSLGEEHSLKLTFSRVISGSDITPNQWELKITRANENGKIKDDGFPIDGGIIKFDENGRLDTTGPITIGNIEFTNGALPIKTTNGNEITIEFDPDKMTQNDSKTSLKMAETDGYRFGTINNITIDKLGRVVGIYSNGQARIDAVIAIARFNNPAGLSKLGDNLFEISANSGDPMVGQAGTDGRAIINPGALEMSNVDLAREFTDMIITQRGFQANSRIITTSDELLQELVNLKR